MPKNLLCSLLFSWIAGQANAQIAKDVMVGGNVDLVKTDNVNLFSKAQIGFEANYFVTRPFTATMGLEIWTAEKLSLVIGGRWFPADGAFVRVRGLIGENDFSVGAGWAKPINENLRFEAMADFYFSIDFAIRAGVAYVIRRK